MIVFVAPPAAQATTVDCLFDDVMECCAATTCCNEKYEEYEDYAEEGGMDMFGGGGGGDGKSLLDCVEMDIGVDEVKEIPSEPAAVENTPASDTTNNETNPSSNQQNVVTYTATSTKTTLDVTKFPALLDRAYDQYDRENAIRPAIIHIGEAWTKQSKKHLLSPVTTTILDQEDQISTERGKVFALLDALTRSGGLMIDHAAFHVLIAGVHRFDESLMNTIIQKNKNPITSVERSYLLMASTLHEVHATHLVDHSQLLRIEEDHRVICNQ
jgi:hypothetical protein